MAADQTVASPFTLSFQRSGGAAVVAATQIWDTGQTPFACVDHQQFDDQSVANDARTITLPQGGYICVFDSSGTPNLNGVYSFALKVDGVSVDTAQGDCVATPGSANRHDQFNLFIK